MLNNDKLPVTILFVSCNLMKKYFLLFLFVSSFVFGQNKKIDSLLALLNTTKSDTVLLNLYMDLSTEYNVLGNIPKSLESYQNGLQLSKKLKDKSWCYEFLLPIGSIYRAQGDSSQALKNYKEALSISLELRNTTSEALVLLEIGELYRKTNMIKALDCYNKALLLFERNGDKSKVAYVYFSIGRAYKNDRSPNFQKALENFQKALAISKDLNYADGIEGALRSIGFVYASMGKLDNAIEYHNKALKVSEENNNQMLIGSNCSGLAFDYLLQKNYKKAKYYSERSISTLEKVNNIVYVLMGAEQIAAKVDSASGNGNDAYEHYKQYIILRDKLNSDEVKKAAVKEKYIEEAERQKAEQDKKDILAIEQRKRQQFVIYSVIGVLLIVIVFSILLYKRFRLTNKQKHIIEIKSQEIEEKNKDIYDSITYAKRLQDAILPPLKEIEENIHENFVLYKPKDIVAGDFYWAEMTSNFYFIAAADCTGHGVPGAMVSMVCSNALNRTVNEFGIIETGKILDNVRDIVLDTFKKSDEEIKDGMDISLFRIDKVNNEIQWSGANNPLWYFVDGELIEIKADKQPIGKYDEPKPFTTHNLKLATPTNFYMFTDGYADQFSPDDKKMTKKRFKNLIVSSQTKTMGEQKQIINDYFDSWRGDSEQVDDVCVIGIRI